MGPDEDVNARRGRTGDPGRVGDVGRTGDVGDTGDRGVTGEPGSPGAAGPAGETGATGERGEVGQTGAKGSPSPELMRLLVTLASVMLIVAAGLSAYSIVQNRKIDRNSMRIDRNERRDTRRSNESRARLCARENLVRAEVHVAYQQGTVDLERLEQFEAAEPLLVQLLRVGEGRRHVSLKRVRSFLPILDCSPNLTGGSAEALKVCQQRRFVELYAAGELEPLPEAEAVRTGPDEIDC